MSDDMHYVLDIVRGSYLANRKANVYKVCAVCMGEKGYFELCRELEVGLFIIELKFKRSCFAATILI